MRLAIMQPYFMPYIGYWQIINYVNKFVVYDDVNYIKKGWINRNRILLNNSDYLFTLPVRNSSQNRLIMDIGLHDNARWIDNFFKTLSLAYKRAPYYNAVITLISECFDVTCSNIASFNVVIINRICRYLKIETEIIQSSVICNNNNLHGQERILDICKQEKADIYINTIAGKELYSKDIFASNGIKLEFIKCNTISYAQFKNEFIPWLSIIDVMMFNSIENIHKMLNNYELL